MTCEHRSTQFNETQIYKLKHKYEYLRKKSELYFDRNKMADYYQFDRHKMKAYWWK